MERNEQTPVVEVVATNSAEFRELCGRGKEGDVWAKYLVGMSLLAEGYKDEALEHLDNALDGGYLPAAVEVAKLRREKKEYRQAVEAIAQAAEEIPEAKIELAFYYLEGICVDRSPETAERLLMEVARDGDGEAKLALARRYKYGNGVPASFGRAMNWLGLAMEAGCEDAFERYYAEERQEEARIAALEDDRTRAEQGELDAVLTMARRYEEGRDVPAGEESAREYYQQAAELGCAEAMYWLGEHALDEESRLEWMRAGAEKGGIAAMYWLGEHYEKADEQETARQWFEKAAELGDSGAMFHLGEHCKNGLGVEKDPAAAMAWYIKAAELGHPAAQYELGIGLKQGVGAEQNVQAGLAWLEKAAGQDCAPACRELGAHYYDLPVGERDYVAAVDWYLKGANLGDAECQCMMGICRHYGYGIDEDAVAATEWYAKAAEQRHRKAQNNLGVCYYTGTGVSKNRARAMALYRASAEQDNITAMSNLAACHWEDKNYSAAGEWYRKAAEQGDARGQFGLGRCYQEGKGVVVKSLFQALCWYEKAADQGNESAIKALAELPEPYRGVRTDDPEGLHRLGKALGGSSFCFERAAELGHAGAKYELGLIAEKNNKSADAARLFEEAAEQNIPGAQYKMGLIAEKNYKHTDAVHWYEAAANGGHAGAQCKMGDFAKRDGKQTDAIGWYAMAAENGFAEAQYELGRCYCRGEGVPCDKEVAKHWLKLALEQKHTYALDELDLCYDKPCLELDRLFMKHGKLYTHIQSQIREWDKGGRGNSGDIFDLAGRYGYDSEDGRKMITALEWREYKPALEVLGRQKFEAGDFKAAEGYFRRAGDKDPALRVAAMRGDAEAQFRYAQLTRNADYYRKAAAQGHSKAKAWVKQEAKETKRREKKQAKAKAKGTTPKKGSKSDGNLFLIILIAIVAVAFLAIVFGVRGSGTRTAVWFWSQLIGGGACIYGITGQNRWFRWLGAFLSVFAMLLFFVWNPFYIGFVFRGVLLILTVLVALAIAAC